MKHNFFEDHIKRWRNYSKAEREIKKSYLKTISEKKGFGILRQLHEFSKIPEIKKGASFFTEEKIKKIIRVKRIFNTLR